MSKNNIKPGTELLQIGEEHDIPIPGDWLKVQEPEDEGRSFIVKSINRKTKTITLVPKR